MKKLLVTLSIVLILVAASLALFSCGGDNGGNKECQHTNKNTVKENSIASKDIYIANKEQNRLHD